ncbi:MAG: hypothetical protein DRR04_08255 [Gammaproteobacteria bacterium]|nr:MAG: hypothetical protein DRQ97_11515 [Gammaproteobacteria bacterium]RLA59522.1 MAG: hypothetical protein DRR04_08255 [Gammaproteobacteria bacterium]
MQINNIGVYMNKFALLAPAAFLAAAHFSPAQAQDELIYVAVEPCRIADTRKSAVGVIMANTSRNFLIAGTAEDMAVQGGVVDCLNPKGDVSPVAISAYILAVPADSSTSQGVLTAYPSDLPPPPSGSGSTVNFAKDQIIGNTTNVTVCVDGSCPSDGELAILARRTDEHVVIDVQGYFYPPTLIPGYEIVQAAFATAGSNTLTAEAICPAGKKVLGGGGSLAVSSWFLDGSYPRPDGLGWRVRYKTSGATFSATGVAWAVCAKVN